MQFIRMRFERSEANHAVHSHKIYRGNYKQAGPKDQFSKCNHVLN